MFQWENGHATRVLRVAALPWLAIAANRAAIQSACLACVATKALKSMIFTILSEAAASGGQPPAWTSFVPLVAMVAIFWFLILRPQMRRQKEQAAKIEAIKKGDQVLTGGGLLGKVIKVDENYAEIELGPNMRVKALKSTITDVIPPSTTAAND